MKNLQKILCILMPLGLISCANAPADFSVSDHHIKEAVRPASNAPDIIQSAPMPEAPAQKRLNETFTVVVNDVPVKELIFAIARDANVEIDVHSDVEGTVTLNAIDATFEELLQRISKQTDIRYSKENGIIYVQVDAPFIKHYEVAYVNMERTSQSTISIATEVSTTGSRESDSVGNISNTSVNNTSANRFWRTLRTNVRNIIQLNSPDDTLGSTETGLAEAAETGDAAVVGEAGEEEISGDETLSDSATSMDAVTISPESGVLTVMATLKQHELVQEYLDLMLGGAQRQVFIEAMIVEVELNDDYQAGVDWSRVLNAGFTEGLTFNQSLIRDNFVDSPISTLGYTDTGSKFQIDVAVSLLSQFGNTKVLSTPKILALNNQTALLKVVDNKIYFTIDVDVETTQFGIQRTFETEIHTLPVGLVMGVTPQISSDNEVTLNVRPTISRIIQSVEVPNPTLAENGVQSFIPEVSVREIETLLKVKNGDVAVIGGLMQDSRSKSTDGLPLLSKIPYLGEAFSYKENKTKKSELVIFLKPIVVNKPSLKGNFARYKSFLEEPKKTSATVK